jgi:ADP-ribose pyrophosphatase YjhB (NUDIX family)
METNEKEQQAVVAYIRREDGKLLSVTRKGTGQHSAPGGKVEPGETLVDAMKREVREEIGLEVLGWTLVHSGLHTSGRRVFSYHVWGWRGEPIASEPGTRVEWVNPIEIVNGFGGERARESLIAAGILKETDTVVNEPWEVVIKGRDLVLGYACSICKIFHGATIYACKWEEAVIASREAAERCCNRKCEDCGNVVGEKYYLVCTDCRVKRDVAREHERFAKAQKVLEADYIGWLYFAGEYHEDSDEIEEYCVENELRWPDWVWACKKIEFKIDVDTILEHALQDHYEDARSSIPQAAEDKLQSILDEWCVGQKIESWQEDNSRAVILEPRKLAGDDA